MLRYTLISLCMLFIISCREPLPIYQKQSKLYHLLISLNPNVDKKEALLLSQDVLKYSQYLKSKFNPIIEPHFNNLLVNIGIKSHGLCYEWSDRVYLHLKKQQKRYRDFRFNLVVSNKGDYFLEHNSCVIRYKNQPLQDGIIVDLWRDIDDIYIARVYNDSDYRWSERLDREID